MDIPERIILNGFTLFLIPLLFNIPFYSKLPMDYFFPDKPSQLLEMLEIISRIIAIICSLFLVMQYKDNVYFKPGLAIYIIGLVLYFASWFVLILIDTEVIVAFHPILRALVVFAPAYLPIIWFVGIALICNATWFIIPSAIFVFFHVSQFVSIYKY